MDVEEAALTTDPADKVMHGTFPSSARFQDSEFFQKAIKMVLRCILSAIFTFQDSNFNQVLLMLIVEKQQFLTALLLH